MIFTLFPLLVPTNRSLCYLPSRSRTTGREKNEMTYAILENTTVTPGACELRVWQDECKNKTLEILFFLLIPRIFLLLCCLHKIHVHMSINLLHDPIILAVTTVRKYYMDVDTVSVKTVQNNKTPETSTHTITDNVLHHLHRQAQARRQQWQ